MCDGVFPKLLQHYNESDSAVGLKKAKEFRGLYLSEVFVQ